MARHAADDPFADPFDQPVIRWDEDRTEFRPSLLVDADTYRPEPLISQTPELESMDQLDFGRALRLRRSHPVRRSAGPDRRFGPPPACPTLRSRPLTPQLGSQPVGAD